MEGFTRNNTDAFHEAAANCQPSPGPADCTNISKTRKPCNGKNCQWFSEVYFSKVDVFIENYKNGTKCSRHVERVKFFAKEEIGNGFWDQLRAMRMGEDASEEILAPETQEKIFLALRSVWNLISEWDLEKPLTLTIEGRYFRPNDKRLTDFAHQKNISKLACEDATFADPLDVLRIAKRLPELEMLGVHVQHMNKQLRSEVANEMRTWKTALPKLKELKLHGEKKRDSSRMNDEKLEDMREDGIDKLCRELRLLTQKDGFVDLELKFVPISAELFQDTQDPKAEMKWPSLKRMKIRLHEMSATGKWLCGVHGYTPSSVPTQGELKLLADLFERAWKGMPKLQPHLGKMRCEGVDKPIKTFKEADAKKSWT